MSEPVKGDGGQAMHAQLPPALCVGGQTLLSYPGRRGGPSGWCGCQPLMLHLPLPLSTPAYC
jgi:hypothetical protein